MRGDEGDVAAEVARWVERFRAGQLKSRQLFRRPDLEDGERFAVQIFSVGVTRHSPGGVRTELGAGRSGLSGALQNGVLGAAWATDRRLFIANPKSVLHEWRWADVTAVRALPDWSGVAVEHGAEGSEAFDVIHRQEALVGPTNRWSVSEAAVFWLRVEAAFVDSRSGLDEWLSDLPNRIAQSMR